jgi:hypothetical protein
LLLASSVLNGLAQSGAITFAGAKHIARYLASCVNKREWVGELGHKFFFSVRQVPICVELPDQTN